MKKIDFRGSNISREIPDMSKLENLRNVLATDWVKHGLIDAIERNKIDNFSRGVLKTLTKVEYKNVTEKLLDLKKLINTASVSDDPDLIKSVFNHRLVAIHTIITDRSLATKIKDNYRYQFKMSNQDIEYLKSKLIEMSLIFKF